MASLKRWIAAVAVVGGILALTGCGPSRRDAVPHNAPSGGQTREHMLASLEQLPGLSIDVAGGGRPNIKGNTGYHFAVTVQPGYRVVDGPALITFLTESAWSVRDGYLPNAQISIGVAAGKGSDFDAAASSAQAGWSPPYDRVPGSSGHTTAIVTIREGAPARERLGAWPGAVPTVPAGVTAAD